MALSYTDHDLIWLKPQAIRTYPGKLISWFFKIRWIRRTWCPPPSAAPRPRGLAPQGHDSRM